jgi:hypothetical protein
MDSNLLALIAIGFVVVVVGLGVVRRLGRNKLRAINMERKVTVVSEMLTEFGRSVIIDADPTAVDALIESVPKSRLTRLGELRWGLKYGSTDDVVIEVRALDGGSEVLVTSMREYWDSPQELPKWTSLVDALVEAAGAAGHATRRGTRGFAFEQPSKGTNGHGRWVLVGQ